MAMAKLALLILVAGFLAGTSDGACTYAVRIQTLGLPLSSIGIDARLNLELCSLDGALGFTQVAKITQGIDTITFPNLACFDPSRLTFSVSATSLLNTVTCLPYVDVTVSGDASYSKHFIVSQLPYILGLGKLFQCSI